jgi:hypothetical protein
MFCRNSYNVWFLCPAACRGEPYDGFATGAKYSFGQGRVSMPHPQS